MASQIRFDPPGIEGLVASGTLVSDAAERLGVHVELACGGVGACTTCAVRLIDNPFALSDVTEAERSQLGNERIDSGVRLACQAYVRDGDCVVRVENPPTARSEDEEAPTAHATAASARERILEEFEHMATSDRVATAFELQMKVAGDLLSTIVDVPLRASEDLISAVFGSSKDAGTGEDAKDTQDSTEGRNE